MNNIGDLNLSKEILPLFDFTLTDFAKETLYVLFMSSLPLKGDIQKRQNIIKGFIAHQDLFTDYSYSRLDFYDVFNFLKDVSLPKSEKGIKLRFLFSEKERHQTRGRFIQLILLFNRIKVFYISKVNTTVFPDDYKRELISINDFLTSFNLDLYDRLVKEDNLKVKHIIELLRIISTKQVKGEINWFYEKLFLFEAYLSISKGIIKYQFSFPSFTETHFSINDVYHPLVKIPVKNSFQSSKNVHLITGPNMSGKSTFLKSVGLCVYLAHLGVAVPATKFELPFFDYISISVTHNDDLLSGYSHFMQEVMGLKNVVIQAGNNKKCFAIFDELFKGTNIEDAVQISTTTVNGLTNFRTSCFLISTHLHQLKDIETVKNKQVETYYLDCDIESNRPIFKYELKEGWSDLKVGELLFEKEGLNDLLQRNL